MAVAVWLTRIVVFLALPLAIAGVCGLSVRVFQMAAGG